MGMGLGVMGGVRDTRRVFFGVTGGQRVSYNLCEELCCSFWEHCTVSCVCGRGAESARSSFGCLW